MRAPRTPLLQVSALHPAMLLVLLVLAFSAVLGATFQMMDTDVWQHLAVGRVIWTQHRIPMTNEWTWPTFGTPMVLPSWGFRALLWPFWALGGMTGISAFRWLTTLATFAILWRVARRLGARGFAGLAMIGWCVLVYRHRIYVRPETLVSVLIAVTVWLLESRRTGGRDHSAWLVLVAWIWANVHISYWILFALAGAHLMEDLLVPPRRGPRLAIVMLAAAAVSFVNPFGWRSLAEPFQYAFEWRNELMFRQIGELQPVDWKFLQRTGFVVLLPLWPLLMVLRAGRSVRGKPAPGWDLAELLSCAGFSVLGIWNQRFVPVWAVVAAPYLARGASSLAGSIPWPAALRGAWTRAALTATLIVAGSLPEWSRADMPIGTEILPSSYPAGACDFIEAHGIRGHGFNHFELGGYMLWRFWPQRDRLPFLDIHLTGNRHDRQLAGMALGRADAWRTLDGERHFDWALLRRLHSLGDVSLDILEADSSWSLVFLDDAAAVYLRRDGAFAGLADSLEYHRLRAGRVGMSRMALSFNGDSTQRQAMRAELERMVASSSANSGAHSMLSQLDQVEGRWDESRAQLIEAHRVDPLVPLFHQRLGMIEFQLHRTREAIQELERATRDSPSAMSWSLLAQVQMAAGNPDAARRAARKAIALDPGVNVGALRGTTVP